MTGQAPITDSRLCLRCRHYYITHEVTMPYGCHALGFRSRRMPCQEVLAASGVICQAFAAKRSGGR